MISMWSLCQSLKQLGDSQYHPTQVRRTAHPAEPLGTGENHTGMLLSEESHMLLTSAGIPSQHQGT